MGQDSRIPDTLGTPLDELARAGDALLSRLWDRLAGKAVKVAAFNSSI